MCHFLLLEYQFFRPFNQKFADLLVTSFYGTRTSYVWCIFSMCHFLLFEHQIFRPFNQKFADLLVTGSFYGTTSYLWCIFSMCHFLLLEYRVIYCEHQITVPGRLPEYD